MVLTDRPAWPERSGSRLTADEFLSLPPDDSRTQLIDGELVMTDARLRHQRIQFTLARWMAGWLDEHPGVGETGIGCNHVIDRHNVFIPDVWFLRQERIPTGDVLAFDGPPDLAAEVRSPSTWKYDIGRKKDLYLAGGISELWLVDTAADVVLVFRGDESLELEAGAELTTPLIPGLVIDVAALFDR